MQDTSFFSLSLSEEMTSHGTDYLFLFLRTFFFFYTLNIFSNCYKKREDTPCVYNSGVYLLGPDLSTLTNPAHREWLVCVILLMDQLVASGGIFTQEGRARYRYRYLKFGHYWTRSALPSRRCGRLNTINITIQLLQNLYYAHTYN